MRRQIDQAGHADPGNRRTSRLERRPLSRTIILATVFLVGGAFFGSISAPAAEGVFSLDRLRVSAPAGAENYIYTAGDVIYPEGGVDTGTFYKFAITDSGGSVRNPGFPCTSGDAFAATDNTYAVSPNDPASTGTSWRYTLQQFGNPACTGPPMKTAFKGFYVAKASVYANSTLSTLKSSFTPGQTAFVRVAGIRPSTNNWNVTWTVPSAATACANTAGADRPESASAGRFPNSASAFLQYRPNTTAAGSAWNRESNYEVRPCPSFGSTSEGSWKLRLQFDSTNFVVFNIFSVDATPPTAPTIANAPPNASASSSATFTFSHPEPEVAFVCQLDGAAFGACASPRIYTGLSAGSHTFRVKAQDPAGNESATSSYSWVVDTAPPVLTLTQPANGSATSQREPLFAGQAGSAAGDQGTVTVKLYAGVGVSGALLQTLSALRQPDNSFSVQAGALADGTYTARAEQADAAGNVGLSNASTFEVDGTPPTVTLTQPADGSTTSLAQPTFVGRAGGAAGDQGVTVKLYAGASAVGTPVQTLSAARQPDGSYSVQATSPLGSGVYTARAEQADVAGNVGVSTANSFEVDVVDRAPPVLSLSQPANGSATSQREPLFAGQAGSAAGDQGTVTVKLYAGVGVSGALLQTLSALRQPDNSFSVQAGALADGTYTARAEQADAAGNVGLSNASTFEVDGTPPTVTLTQPGDGVRTNDPTPTFAGAGGTAAGDAGTVTVRLYAGRTPTGTPVQTLSAAIGSGGAYAVDASPALSDGSYTVRVEQADAAGNLGLSSAITFDVDGAAPVAAIVSGPSGPTAATDASFEFVANESATFACALDQSPVAACTSPQAYANLSQGPHTFQVQAIDSLGNTGAAATRSWTVDTVAPSVALSQPASGSQTSDSTPTFSGTGGTSQGDAVTATIKVYAGSSASGAPLQTLSAAIGAGGTYSVDAASALAGGTYTARAEQTDAAGNAGISSANTFTVTAPVATYRGTVLADSPVSYWRLGEATGTSAADELSRNPATYSGGFTMGQPGAIDGDANTAVLLNGTSGFVSAPTSSSLNLADGPVSLEAWVKRATLNRTDIIIHKGTNAYQLRWTSANRLALYKANVGVIVVSASTVTDTGWHHVVGTKSGSAVKLYIDGVDVTGTVTNQTLADATSSSLRIGTDSVTWMSGLLDEVAIYNQVLSPDRVSAHYFAARHDATPPSLTLTSPANGSSTNDATPTFSGSAGTAAGDSTAVTVKIYSGPDVTGTPVQTLGTTRAGNGSYAVDAPAPLALGIYTARAEQQDATGNTGFTSANTFTVSLVDSNPPAITLVTPANGSSSTDTTPTFSGTAGTAQGDSMTVTVRIYGGTATSGTPVQTLTATWGANGGYSVDATSALPEQTYTAQAQQQDDAGNVGLSSANTFTVTLTDPILLAAGDIASCDPFDGDAETAAILDTIPQAAVATLGDTVYDTASLAEFNQCYHPTWGRAKTRTRPAVGGHDYTTPGAAGYFGYFGAAAGDPSKGYYGYELGNWHVIVLNSCEGTTFTCEAGSAQEQWLRQDLAAHPNLCTLAYWHTPRFSSGSVHGSRASMQPFWQALYDYGADVVLNGHEHLYERFAPQTPTGLADPAFGIRQFTVGTGGYFLYDFGKILPTSEARIGGVYGVIKLVLHPSGYEWTFLPEAGKTATDAGSGSCHVAPSP